MTELYTLVRAAQDQGVVDLSALDEGPLGIGDLLFDTVTNLPSVVTTPGAPGTAVVNPLTGVVAKVDLTGQGAAITTATLFTPAESGLFRVSYYAAITTVDGSSSSLGGLGGFIIGWTEAENTQAQTFVVSANTSDALTGVLQGAVPVNAKAAVAITYAIGYASNTSAKMKFTLRLRVEALT